MLTTTNGVHYNKMLWLADSLRQERQKLSKLNCIDMFCRFEAWNVSKIDVAKANKNGKLAANGGQAKSYSEIRTISNLKTNWRLIKIKLHSAKLPVIQSWPNRGHANNKEANSYPEKC